MVKGLISQLIVSVITSPFGRRPTALSEPRSMAIIIGYTMAQISTATMRLTEAYSMAASALNSSGIRLPRASPARMHSATQSVR